MNLRFLDFDLLFERREAGDYRVRVVASPAGQAAGVFALPFSELEIENFLLRFGASRSKVRRFGSSQLDAARNFGGRLYEAVFRDEVRSCLRSSLDEAQRADAGLRIRIRLSEAPELNDLPWEYLLQPSLDRFLALSAETPVVRYLELGERIRPLQVSPPLRVLAVIASPSDYPELDVEDEWRKLQEPLNDLQERGLLVLKRLERPTVPQLQHWLRRGACNIFHFIGHGGYDERTEDGLLLFCDEQGRGRAVSGQTLGTLLHDHRPLRLAVLNACEGARTSRTDPFAGVAQSLVQQGIPAVVAMQFEISDDAAIKFSSELYGAVADGYPVDAALAEARKALYFAGHDLEWGTPVLYMRSPDGKIFDVAGSSDTAAAAAASAVNAATKPLPVAAVMADMRRASDAALQLPAAPPDRPPPRPSAPPPLITPPSEAKATAQPAPSATPRPAPVTLPHAADSTPTPAAAINWPAARPTVSRPSSATASPPEPSAPPPPGPAVHPPTSPASPSRPVGSSGPTTTEPASPALAATGASPLFAAATPQRAQPPVERRLPLRNWVLAGCVLVLSFLVTVVIVLVLSSYAQRSPSASATPPLEPMPEREPGVYLVTPLPAGEKIDVKALDIVDGKGDGKEPAAATDIAGACAAKDLTAGQRVLWSDVATCL